jgi:hypothetical protein
VVKLSPEGKRLNLCDPMLAWIIPDIETTEVLVADEPPFMYAVLLVDDVKTPQA